MGTTYKSILFIVFAALLGSNTAHALSCIEANQLSLGGIHFSGNSECVPATKDGKGYEQCQNKYPSASNFAVNPSNDNYSGSIGEGDFSSNKLGYYLCIKKEVTMEDFAKVNPDAAQVLQAQPGFNINNIQLNDKETMCEQVASVASPWLKQGEGYELLKFEFKQQGSQSDGICLVGYEGGPMSEAGSAPPPPPPEIIAQSRANRNPPEPTATSTPEAAAIASTTLDERLNRCIQSHLTKAQECETEAEAAKNSCDESNPNNAGNRNSTTRMASGATQIMGQVYNMQNQASGMQAECFRAGAAANTASTAIGEMETVCKRDFSNCNRLCNGTANETRLAEYKRLCSASIGKTTAELEADRTTPNGVAFNDAAARIQGIIEPALRVCTVDAKKNKDTLSKLLDGVGRALQSSVQCACQTSSTGQNCNNIPPVRDCTMIPQPAGCGGYEAMATCSVGAPGYNAKECACMQNPAAPGCGGGSNAISAFSGPPIANNLARGTPGGGVNFGGGASGGRGSGFSIGANADVENGDLSFLNSAKPIGASGPPIGGGGGTPGAGGSSNGNATDDKGAGLMGEEEKGIGGIFNQAKTFMSRALGYNRKPAAKKSGNGALGKPDMGRFKPLRGLAGRSGGMGSRNMDIWKMMNACTSGDTCKSNENNYLLAP